MLCSDIPEITPQVAGLGYLYIRGENDSGCHPGQALCRAGGVSMLRPRRSVSPPAICGALVGIRSP